MLQYSTAKHFVNEMEDIKPTRPKLTGVGRVLHRPSLARAHRTATNTSPVADKASKTYRTTRSLGRAAHISYKRKKTLYGKILHSAAVRYINKTYRRRAYAILILILFVVSEIGLIMQPFLDSRPYNISQSSRELLPRPAEKFAKLLQHDYKKQTFEYNASYTGKYGDDKIAGDGSARINASFKADKTAEMTVTDPVSDINVTMKPKFGLAAGKQDQNQLFYRMSGVPGHLVYTGQAASVKEDIVLEHYSKDQLTFKYELELQDGLEARLQKDGSVGVFGPSLPIMGNVSTGTEKDTELLQKARQNSTKDKILFTIPAPVVIESGKKNSEVQAYFELEGNILSVVTGGLKNASYPLTIDPSVYVQSAAQLMRGNNESNVAFDVSNELFKKGSTTGARIDQWTETGAMNDQTYDQGTATSGSYVYRAGGRTGRIMPYIASQKETAIATTTATFTMSMPDVRPAGDLYVAIISHDGTGVVTPPVGGNWTEYADTREHAAYWKIGEDKGGGNEQATWAFTGGTVEWAGVILRIKNFDPADVVSGTAGTGSNASAATPIYPTTTPDKQGTLVIRAAGFNDDIPGDRGYSPAGHSDVASGHSGGAGTTDSGFVVSTIDSPPLSGVATGTATLADTDISDTYGASSIAINSITATPAYNQTLQWAHFNSTTGAIDSPTPGSTGGACSGWCTNSAYNLPSASPSATNSAGNVGMSLVAYNGYLYAMGGYDGTYVKSTVYIARLGSNGEPSLWHPTDPDKANWAYWHKDTGLNGATARAYHAAYAYNGKMYILGGRTTVSGNGSGVTTVEIADILPNGTLGSWSAGQALPEARWGLSVQGYNGYLYILGGGNSGTLLNTVYSNHLSSSGTMSTWQQTTSFNTARESHGGTMSGIWGAYIYLAGGCTTVNATGTGYCSAIGTDMQLASINADGSLDVWNTMANLNNTRFGSSFIAWQDNLYRFGGCSRQDTTTGDCYATHIDIQYGTINQDGDASTVSVTTASGAGLCTGSDPHDCNLPPVGDGAGEGGQLLANTAILNGYLYIIGGCASLACDTGVDVSGNVSYVAISSDGKLKSPPSCAGTVYGSWCVDDTNQINGATGVAASGVAIFGNTIYVVGGLNGAANVTSIYRNTTNSDGSLAGAWTAQTFAAAGVTQDLSYTFAYARANPASAATYPGNLYIFGGCASTAGAGCTGADYRTEVWKCNIMTTGALETADANDCDTANQLQIDSDAGTGGSQGLAVHAGTVYANYIYLLGGLNQVSNDLNEVRYAKFDNNNNVVAVSGGVWVESPVTMNVGRRRGTAFGYNGYLYAVGGFEATASLVLDTIEYVKLDVTNGSLIGTANKFNRSAVTISQRWGLGLAVSNSFAYIVGGCRAGISPGGCSALDPTIQTFQVYNNDSGAPADYTTSSNLYTTDRIGAGVAILNGYIYIAGGCVSTTDCTDATDNVQYAAIDTNGVVGAWANTTDSTLPGQRAYGQLEAAGGTLYFIGGQEDTSTNESADVYYGTPSAGNVSSWTDASNDLPAARTQSNATVWNNRIYVTGGLDGSAAATTTIYASPSLASGGDIGSAWTTTGMTAFNVARSGHVAISYANNLYILGGFNGTNYLSDVQFAQISSTGTIGSWTYTTSLPMPLRQADGFASNGYMYLFGGRSSTNDCTARTLVAPISANTTIASGNNPTGIGEWYQTNRNFDGGRYGVGAGIYQGKAYVLGGGCQGYVMQDNFDPSVDATQWSYTTNMSADTVCQSTSDSNTFRATDGVDTTTYAATNDVNVSSGGTVHFKLYIPGADTGSCLAPDAPGFLSGVTEDVLLQYSNSGGAWTTIATYAYTQYDPLRRVSATIPAGAQSATTKFRWVYDPDAEAGDMFALDDVYIVATGSSLIDYASARVSQTALLSQPQIAIYSRLIDADKDVFPTVWLMNGLDNSIGARWQMRYRSMNDPTVTNANKACGGSAMSAYGQETIFGDVTLGKPEAYTVKNSGGTNISCGRFFFMTVSIDASQTYGYPDDITRGPTLEDLALFFKANPGKRLIHGKTFIEGTQQPLDTQCGISNPIDTSDVCPNP